MVLVDTTVWSVAFRRKPHTLDIHQERARNTLASLIEANRAQLLGPVRQELLSGIRERANYLKLRDLLRAFRDVPLDQQDYEQGGEMHNACQAKGIAGNSVDFLICAVAARRTWLILTLDRDFDRYASCLSIDVLSANS
jgi:predicted nucleic acid-binding protein